MKKFLTAFLVAFTGLFLVACQNTKTENNASNEANTTLTLKVGTAP
ncbi:basic amino acid ABC transporter substrate-binding protein, partial [Campylobacter jejuni]|nr:basic amino acid ABC transporter substrate-binding protein [Campylobacter jejuni]